MLKYSHLNVTVAGIDSLHQKRRRDWLCAGPDGADHHFLHQRAPG